MIIPKCLGFKKSTYFFTGFRIQFGIQTGTLEIVKNHFSQKMKVKLKFLERKCEFCPKLRNSFRNSKSKLGNSSFLSL